MGIEKPSYQPSEEEMKKAQEIANEVQNERGEKIMTEEEKKMTAERIKALAEEEELSPNMIRINNLGEWLDDLNKLPLEEPNSIKTREILRLALGKLKSIGFKEMAIFGDYYFVPRKKINVGEVIRNVDRDRSNLGELKSELMFLKENDEKVIRNKYLIPSLDQLKTAREILKSKVFDNLFISQLRNHGIREFNDGLIGGPRYEGYYMIAQKDQFSFNLGEISGNKEPITKDEIGEVIKISEEMGLNEEFISKLKSIKKLLDLDYKHYMPVFYYHPEYYRSEEETPDEIYSSRGSLVSPYQHQNFDSYRDPVEVDAIELDGRIFLLESEEETLDTLKHR